MHYTGNQHLRLDEVMAEDRMTAPAPASNFLLIEAGLFVAVDISELICSRSSQVD